MGAAQRIGISSYFIGGYWLDVMDCPHCGEVFAGRRRAISMTDPQPDLRTQLIAAAEWCEQAGWICIPEVNLPDLLRAAAEALAVPSPQLQKESHTRMDTQADATGAATAPTNQTIRALEERIAWLEGTAMPHARKQENANGFQRGWHAALSRAGERSEPIEALRSLVPEPCADVDNTLPWPLSMPVWKCGTCGSLWRDNLDGSVSLFNAQQKSCEICELDTSLTTCQIYWLPMELASSVPAVATPVESGKADPSREKDQEPSLTETPQPAPSDLRYCAACEQPFTGLPACPMCGSPVVTR